MNALDDLLPPTMPDDGGELLTQLVAAVDFLRRGASPGLTVWDAMEQALRIFGNFEADWLDPDPLMRAIRVSTSIVGHLTTAAPCHRSITKDCRGRHCPVAERSLLTENDRPR
jgi:hypothetical protein